MDEAKKDSLRKAIQKARANIDQGLILDPEVISQLYRMILYYEDKLKEE